MPDEQLVMYIVSLRKGFESISIRQSSKVIESVMGSLLKYSSVDNSILMVNVYFFLTD